MRWFRDSRGFTLIEIMVAVAISAIVLMFVFNIQFRMTESYTVQSRVSDIQYTLQTIRSMVDREAKLAGAGFPQGFRTNLPLVDLDGNGTGDFPMITNSTLTDPNKLIPGIQLVPGSAGDDADPDTAYFYWGDPDRAGIVTGCNPGGNGNSPQFTIVNLTNADAFAAPTGTAPGEIVLVKIDVNDPDNDIGTLPQVVTEACVGRVTVRDNSNPAALTILWDPVPVGSSAACAFVCAAHSNANPTTEIMTLRGVGYRVSAIDVDTGSPVQMEGVLQRNSAGRLASPTTQTTEGWEDIALGIVDFQVGLDYVRTNNDVGALPTAPEYQVNGFNTVIAPQSFPCPSSYEPCSGTPAGQHDLSRSTLVNGVTASTSEVIAQPFANGGGDLAARSLTFHVFAHSLKQVQGAVADGLLAASDRTKEMTQPATGYLSGAYRVSNNRAVRFLRWTSDLRNLGSDY